MRRGYSKPRNGYLATRTPSPRINPVTRKEARRADQAHSGKVMGMSILRNGAGGGTSLRGRLGGLAVVYFLLDDVDHASFLSGGWFFFFLEKLGGLVC